jgi:hypothetical protein
MLLFLICKKNIILIVFIGQKYILNYVFFSLAPN